ncbi:MAG: DUF4276 family protein [Gammaproteobacteria bacterium]|nr:DUF4276 family protein [Gammaproteobacteria bacterium]
MVEIIVVGEGRTEEDFLAKLVAPALASQGVYVRPRLLRTSGNARGGALTWGRVLHHLPRFLKERRDVYVSTFFDLYGLAPDFPGVGNALSLGDPLSRATAIEDAFRQDIVAAAKCPTDRFLPHIQPHEFEALLFSDVSRFATVRPEWEEHSGRLSRERASAPTPEHINDGPTSHPSARLQRLLSAPPYRKRIDGLNVAKSIGLGRIRAECPHFAGWLARLEALPPLDRDPGP